MEEGEGEGQSEKKNLKLLHFVGWTVAASRRLFTGR